MRTRDSASRVGRITRALFWRQTRPRPTRSRAVAGRSVGPAGRVFRRETPDGRVIVVAFHVPRSVWQAKETGAAMVYESRSLRDAVADACGDDPDAPWIRILETEITAASAMASEPPS
jgi:hypothetical protein